METKEIYRQYFSIKGLEVSDRGSVRRSYKDPYTSSGWSIYPHKLTWQTDDDGNVIVRTKDYGDLRVDNLVARCFWGKPRGENTYLIHKDKDKTNCSKDNLQWVTKDKYDKFYADDPVINTENGFRQVSNGFYVSRDGKVKETKKGKVMKVYYTLYDSDTDSWVEINPHVVYYPKTSYNPKRLSIDELVAEAYLPTPGIGMGLLHKDNDYRNYSLDNLEWVEYGSERYQQYLERRQKDVAIRNEELNRKDV